MMRFSDYQKVINEAFNKPLKWKWTEKARNEYSAEFTTPSGREMMVGIEKLVRTWEIMFAPKNPPKNGEPLALTGENEPIPILATVLDIIKAFVEEMGGMENVNKINFIADKEDKGRASAYKKLAQRMLPKDWKLDVEETDRAVSFTISSK